MLTHVDLFSGIGGFALAAQWAGFKTIAFCENDTFCQEVLKKHWASIPIQSNIKRFKWPMANARLGRTWRIQYKSLSEGAEASTLGPGGQIISHPKGDLRRTSGHEGQESFDGPGAVTLLTGGFPCQPFSVAGKRRGKEDNRDLWPYMFRVIKKIRPHWIIGENVAGFVRMELDRSLSDLEDIGYACQAFVIPACAVDAKHRRDRVWIVGHAVRVGLPRFDGRGAGKKPPNGCSNVSLPGSSRLQNRNARKNQLRPHLKSSGKNSRRMRFTWPVEPALGRVAHGVPNRVDRLKALGNAIVPQVAYEICKSIAEIEGRTG